MDLKAIRELAQRYSVQELTGFADELEATGKCAASEKGDAAEIMSDLLQAAEVRQALDKGVSLNEAIRDLAKRVRAVFS